MLQSKVIEIASRHGCSPVNLPYVFKTHFPKNTSGEMLPFHACLDENKEMLPFHACLEENKSRNSLPEIFCKKSVFKGFAKFTVKKNTDVEVSF